MWEVPRWGRSGRKNRKRHDDAKREKMGVHCMETKERGNDAATF